MSTLFYSPYASHSPPVMTAPHTGHPPSTTKITQALNNQILLWLGTPHPPPFPLLFFVHCLIFYHSKAHGRPCTVDQPINSITVPVRPPSASIPAPAFTRDACGKYTRRFRTTKKARPSIKPRVQQVTKDTERGGSTRPAHISHDGQISLKKKKIRQAQPTHTAGRVYVVHSRKPYSPRLYMHAGQTFASHFPRFPIRFYIAPCTLEDKVQYLCPPPPHPPLPQRLRFKEKLRQRFCGPSTKHHQKAHQKQQIRAEIKNKPPRKQTRVRQKTSNSSHHI